MKSVLTLTCGIAICVSLVGCSSYRTKHYDPTTGLVYGSGFSNSGSGGLLGFLAGDKKQHDSFQVANAPFGYQTAGNCQCYVPQQQCWNGAGTSAYAPIGHPNSKNGTHVVRHTTFANGNCGTCGAVPKVTSCGTCGRQSNNCGTCGRPSTCDTCGTSSTISTQPSVETSNGCNTCANGIVSGEFPIEVYNGAVDGAVIQGEIINGEPMPAPPAETDDDSKGGKTDNRAPLPEKEAKAGESIEQLKWIPRRL